MSYIGKTPTPVPLTSSDIVNGIVTGEKLNADVISSQTALAVAPADTDEFLINDAGTLKRIDYSLIKGGYVLLHDATPTASSNLDISLTGGFYQYSIRGIGLELSGSDAEIDLYFTTDNFSSTDSAMKSQRKHIRLDSSGEGDTRFSGYVRVVENLGAETPDSCDFEFTLANASRTSRSNGYGIWGNSVYGHTDAGHAYHYILAGRSDTTGTVDGIRFAISDSQTFVTTGRIQIYGIGKI